MQRNTFIRATYMAFMLPSAILAGLAGTVAFLAVTGLSPTAHPANRLIFVPLIALLLFSFLVGASCGGWVWSRVAKRFLGVTREEMNVLFFSSTFKIGHIDRANQRSINKLYGPK
jgi:hypothetical protein